jgi:protein-tyrosine phosphatase
MDPSRRPVNYRDVGEALGLWLDPSPIPAGRLLRGGRLDVLTTARDLGHPRTILNLRRGPDGKHLEDVRYVQVAAANELENYSTRERGVRKWIAEALGVLADPGTAWPVYVHCTSGRDRTGVVVAAALLVIGVPRGIVIDEYLLSDGADRRQIQRAVDGILGGAGTLGVNPAVLRAALGRRR